MNGKNSSSSGILLGALPDSANSHAPQKVKKRRSEHGGTAARVMFVFFLIGVLVLFLLLRGCYKMAKSTYDSAHKSFSEANANRVNSKPKAKTLRCPNLDPPLSASLLKGEAASAVPVKPNLVFTQIWYIQEHDFENLATVNQVDDHLIRITTSGPGVTFKAGKIDHITPSTTFVPHDVCQSDFNDSHALVTVNTQRQPSVILGSTHLSISRSTFALLKDHKKAQLDYRDGYWFVGDGYSWNTDDPGYFNLEGPTKYHVIVNGAETDLPAISARGSVANNAVHLVVLDDPDNPQLLDYDNPSKQFRIHITKINFPVEDKIHKELADKGRAEIYGIYFDFDSDRLRPESDQVLAEIADVMKKQPDWKLSVEGHTDNVGGDKHNLDLSQRRAASVIAALTSRYRIEPSRLSPIGYGASRPKAPNDTVDGRALNRRVELVRK
jgi:outer membrane protein OmpA-like peptidoglycan-associated protein